MTNVSTMARRILVVGLATGWLLAVGETANAQINYIGDLGLYNTGVDDSGNPLPSASVDPHYVATESADPENPAPPAADARNWGILPAPPWIPNNAPGTSSNWISAGSGIIYDPPDTNDGLSDTVGGTFVYETTFDLGALDPGSTELIGRWVADDEGVDILVNGDGGGVIHDTPSFGTWRGFRITSGLVAGSNSVSFEVRNGGDARTPNPHGVRVEWGIVPEPAGALLIACGLAAAALRRRSQRG